MKKSLLLSQIIAADKTIKPRVNTTTTDLYHKLKKADLFAGLKREYKPLDDADKEILPPESKKVQFTVAEIIEANQKALAEFWDITARREHVNTRAFADVVIDGQTILTKVPVGLLLFLEKQLIDLKTQLANIPTLDLTEDWELDEHSGLYRTHENKTHRTKKTPKVIVKHAPTEHHPAQTELFMEDNIVGYWHATKTSGAMPPVQKAALVTKFDKLIVAVKLARESANSTKEDEVYEISSALFHYMNSDD